MTKPILNISELEYKTMTNGDRFEARLGAIGSRLGAQKLGYNEIGRASCRERVYVLV